MRKRSKRYKELQKKSVKNKKLSAKEIIDLVKENSNAKFDESIDVSLRINLKQSKGGDFSLRTTVKLPNGSGKKNKIAVLCESDKIDEAKKKWSRFSWIRRFNRPNIFWEVKFFKINLYTRDDGKDR